MADGQLTVDYFRLTAALGSVLDSDDEVFWLVVAALDREFPNLAWANAMTDGRKLNG